MSGGAGHRFQPGAVLCLVGLTVRALRNCGDDSPRA